MGTSVITLCWLGNIDNHTTCPIGMDVLRVHSYDHMYHMIWKYTVWTENAQIHLPSQSEKWQVTFLNMLDLKLNVYWMYKISRRNCEISEYEKWTITRSALNNQDLKFYSMCLLFEVNNKESVCQTVLLPVMDILTKYGNMTGWLYLFLVVVTAIGVELMIRQ